MSDVGCQDNGSPIKRCSSLPLQKSLSPRRSHLIKSPSFTFQPFFTKETYFCEHDCSDVDKVTTYITWVNNQLSRDPNTAPITTLEHGLSDGVTLPRLLHVLGDDPVPGVVIPPRSDSVRKQNIRLCFQYLQQRHIHPRNSTAPDVSSGNLKCIMRLLLALAANFKTYKSDRIIGGFNNHPTGNGTESHSGLNGTVMKHCNSSSDLANSEEMNWMYDQVIDTRKQIEGLKYLLLKDISDEEKAMLEDQNSLDCFPPLCNKCDDTQSKIEAANNTVKSTEQLLAVRDQQIMELKAEILHLKTRDKYLSSEVEERSSQISKLKSMLDKRQSSKDATKRNRDEKKQLLWQQQKHNTSTTKILYYFGNSSTPYLSQINRRIGEITLRDFKNVINRSGCYRYNFKSYDKDFGPVKQEVSTDDTILPAWDGRVIGFVEEQATSLDQIEI